MKSRIRKFVPEDAEAVVELWQDCGLTRPWNDPHADIERCLASASGILLVAEDRVAPDQTPTLMGTVMVGSDGHRGWMYYLASNPQHRGRGIGRALVAEAEQYLEVIGCLKAQLMVRSDNEVAIGFYEALGYEVNEVVVLGKRLIDD